MAKHKPARVCVGCKHPLWSHLLNVKDNTVIYLHSPRLIIQWPGLVLFSQRMFVMLLTLCIKELILAATVVVNQFHKSEPPRLTKVYTRRREVYIFISGPLDRGCTCCFFVISIYFTPIKYQFMSVWNVADSCNAPRLIKSYWFVMFSHRSLRSLVHEAVELSPPHPICRRITRPIMTSKLLINLPEHGNTQSLRIKPLHWGYD